MQPRFNLESGHDGCAAGRRLGRRRRRCEAVEAVSEKGGGIELCWKPSCMPNPLGSQRSKGEWKERQHHAICNWRGPVPPKRSLWRAAVPVIAVRCMLAWLGCRRRGRLHPVAACVAAPAAHEVRQGPFRTNGRGQPCPAGGAGGAF